MKDSAYRVSDIYINESVTHILAFCIFLLSGGSHLGKFNEIFERESGWL
jgi:hypothetical protein